MTEYARWRRHVIVRTLCVFSVIVAIYVICVKRPHQFLRTVGLLRETGPAAYLQFNVGRKNYVQWLICRYVMGITSYCLLMPREYHHQYNITRASGTSDVIWLVTLSWHQHSYSVLFPNYSGSQFRWYPGKWCTKRTQE